MQLLNQGVVTHQTVSPGARGEYKGQTMVAIQGVAEGATLLNGTVGTLLAGTAVKVMPGAQ